MRVYMQMPPAEERPPRYYHLFLHQDLLEGWTLVKEWGFQGASGRVVREHFVSRDAAEEALITSREQQVRRGYRVMFTEGQGLPR